MKNELFKNRSPEYGRVQPFWNILESVRHLVHMKAHIQGKGENGRGEKLFDAYMWRLAAVKSKL